MKTKLYFLLFFQCVFYTGLAAQYFNEDDNYDDYYEKFPCDCKAHKLAIAKQITCNNTKNDKLVFYCTLGKKHGDVTAYYASGAIQSKSFYKKGKLNGEYIGYYESGAIERKAFYIKGKQQGEEILYYANGNIFSKIFYENGQEQGDAIWYHKSGSIEQTAFYKAALLQGEFIKYNEAGIIIDRRIYKDRILNKQQTYNDLGAKTYEYTENDTLKQTIIYYTTAEGGGIKTKETINKLDQDTTFITYHPSGNVASERFHKKSNYIFSARYYDSGKIESIHTKEFSSTYYESGAIKSKYINNTDKIEYYESGAIKAKYINNREIIEYYESGIIKHQSITNHDTRQTLSIYYDENGNINQKRIYTHKPTSCQIILYYPSGAIQSKSLCNSSDNKILETITYTEEENIRE